MVRLLPFWLLLIAGGVAAETVTIDHVLVLAGTRLERPAVDINPVERARAVGTWAPPAPGSDWITVQADSAGWIVSDGLLRGYAYAEMDVEEDSTWLLDAMGYVGVYVNDEPHVGNVYGYKDDWAAWEPHSDYSVVPVRLQKGVNHFLFFGSRYGRMRARLTRIEEGLSFNGGDTTLPDLVVGRDYRGWGSVVVVNATAEVVIDAAIEATFAPGETKITPVPALPPYGVRKVGFALAGPGPRAKGKVSLQLNLTRGGNSAAHQEFELEGKEAHDNRRVTFRSGIDGSVQYYGFLPSTGSAGPNALFLSLHGASVEAINQLGSYPALSWGDLVAPTNRRPFGFSWEDWGRRDALEVLDLARDRLGSDPDRIYLTGHSMGGHGSWHLATLLPDRFAAVGPSAGWISIWSYRQDPPSASADPLIGIVERGTLPSRTLDFAPNLAGMGVYVLHGDIDDNVPPQQAYLMLKRLSEFHHDYVFHEEPDAGHWWDHSPDAGADCVSWPPMFDFFARHRRPSAQEVRAIRFRTPSPSVSVWNHWAGVITQKTPFALSEIALDRDAGWTRVTGTTVNVEVLALDFSWSPADSVRITLDGCSLVTTVPVGGTIWLSNGGGEAGWSVTQAPDPRSKGPRNNGGFRSAFVNRVQLVYGTRGSPQENAWALAKARYDAEWLWYQGNASIDVLPDTMFDPAAEPERSVVLYGNASTHQDWNALVDDAVNVDRNILRIGTREFTGENLGLLAVRPRPGSDTASVGLVSATGSAGFRLMNRRPYLFLGVAYPDVSVFGAKDSGPIVLGAGYFGNDWTVARGEFVWEDGP